MILGIGTDIVKISRFKSWKNYSKEQLLRVFSKAELNYCYKRGNLDAINLESLASRFAVKEAFFKAISQAMVQLNETQNSFSLLFVCQNIEVVHTTWDVPSLKVNWQAFNEKIAKQLPEFRTCVSISHEKSYTISFVVIFLA